MSISEAHKVIQGLVRSESLHAQRDNLEKRPPTTITLSHDHGCGGYDIARRLSERLGVRIWDSEILQAIAEAAHVEPELMAELDEKVRSRYDAFIYNFFSGKDVTVTAYRRHLVNVVLAMAAQGGIIMGRGAHLVLANRPVFRLRIVGSLVVCSARVAKRSGRPEPEARAEVERVNKERSDFLHSDFHARLDDAARFDLVVNTDRFGERWDEVAKLVIDAMAVQGLKSSRSIHE